MQSPALTIVPRMLVLFCSFIGRWEVMVRIDRKPRFRHVITAFYIHMSRRHPSSRQSPLVQWSSQFCSLLSAMTIGIGICTVYTNANPCHGVDVWFYHCVKDDCSFGPLAAWLLTRGMFTWSAKGLICDRNFTYICLYDSPEPRQLPSAQWSGQ